MADEPSAKQPSSGLEATIPAPSESPEGTAGGADPPLASGGRYRLGPELGRGGMGRVVEAFDTQLGRTVAFKEVLAAGGDGLARRFRREVQITAKLEHASIVPLYDAGTLPDGRPYYVMRRVTGRPLDELIARAHALPDRLALLPNVLAAIDAVAHAHKRGVIHRDLKPSNILVGELGETVVIDWGLAKVIGEAEPASDDAPPPSESLHTQVGSVFGTPGFMAPEQARGDELGPSGDVFALGATLYHVMAGRPPLKGTSATEVIASTLQHEIAPLTTVCPGAPAELATIIDKALAFEAGARYADASELAEDVRRFLTGQLVGAHRYTRWQRLARFARRHRAVLSVSALAAAAVAVLAWVGVARIMTERDAAQRARAEAEHQRASADGKAAQLRERADQLLVAHARTTLDRDPTRTIALLKQLERATSPVVEEAAALAKAAIVRGVAWGLPTLPGATTSFAMSPDGERLVQVNRAGELQIVDLELRRAVFRRDLGRGSTAMWVDDGRRLLVLRTAAPPLVVDPSRGTEDVVGTRVVKSASATATGDRVALLDADGELRVLDVATGEQTQVATDAEPTGPLEIAPDASFIAFRGRAAGKPVKLVVVDAAGRVMIERPGPVSSLATASDGRLALSVGDGLLEVRPAAPTPAFVRLPIDPPETYRVYGLHYAGDVLYLLSGDRMMSWNGRALSRGERIDDMLQDIGELPGGAIATSAADGKFYLQRKGARVALVATGRPDGPFRLATSARSGRVAIAARDAIFVWRTEGLVPALTSLAAPSEFVTPTRLLVNSGPSTWFAHDLVTGERSELPLDEPEAMSPLAGVHVQSEDGRMLLFLRRLGGPEAATQAVVLGPDLARRARLPDLPGPLARLVSGDAVVFAPGGARVLGQIGDDAPRELIELDGDVISVAATGRLEFAALSSKGELVRARFDGSELVRTRVPTSAGFLAADPAGDVLVADGNRLLRWRTDLEEVARFADGPEGEIAAIWALASGTLVELAGKDLHFVGPTGATPRWIPAGPRWALGGDGRLLASVVANQIELVDLPSGARWSLPKVFPAAHGVLVSPDARRVTYPFAGAVVTWELPEVGSDFRTWLDELTNATSRDDQLIWPWQVQP
jgi:hypothetical protein